MTGVAATLLRTVRSWIRWLNLWCVRTAPDWSLKSGPFQAEAVARRWSIAVTAHRVLSLEGVRQMVAPDMS